MAKKTIKGMSEKRARSHRDPIKSKNLLTKVARKPARVAHPGKSGASNAEVEELELPVSLNQNKKSRTAQIREASR